MRAVKLILACAASAVMAGCAVAPHQDRLTQPLLRVNAKGEFDKKGKFAPVSWKRAFDEMEKQFKKAYEEIGPTGVAILGSVGFC